MQKPSDSLLKSDPCSLVRTGLQFVGMPAFKKTLLGSLLSVFSLHASAQLVPLPAALSPIQTIEEGLRRQEERVREQLQQLEPSPNVLQPEVSTKPLSDLPEETPCFAISEVSFEGEDARRFTWLQQDVAPFLGRCVGVHGLSYIASLLDAKLIEFGYVTTKVTLPAQNLSGGTLSFRLHAGKIAGVRMQQAGTPGAKDEAWGTWWNAFPTGSGNILNIRDLEQGAEQMQRLPSQAIRTRIEPGSEPDTSVLMIERQAGGLTDRTRGGITLDNSGSKSLGRTHISGYLSLDNPFGLNDLLNLSASSNAENPGADRRSQGLSLSYSIPFGYSTLSFSKSHSRFAQTVQGTTVRFLSSGESDTDELRLHHILLRTGSAKFGAYATLSARRAKSYLDDVELIVQRRRTTNFETGITFKKLIADASLDFDVGYRRGMPWRDAQEDFPAVSGLTLRPKIWGLSAAFSKPFALANRTFRYNMTLRAQRTDNATLSVDQIAIGSRYTVRGFDGDSVLLAEKGFYLRNDVATIVNLIGGLNSQVYISVDLGRVWGPSDINLIGNKLAGAVIGLRGQWASLQFDAALGTPLYKPSGFKTRHVNPYIAVTYVF